ncbi:hypothetical protein K493DRAFT_240637 [Basidiobolus meristosporus CBS 931.73]|uniref:Late embryogenesis abundant protein LEA-2 subgroup domain-containing protein n=1 Tax=Basidiobolus meristosporus CBS 931.73 TaxID=1314790 RepID=A0A1Y1XA93_9FUNG|nr:hypothetical protein K493DRAFT_240637 [Basidiobolus meristosporus CBS 931.73]|eukprot:ORX82665.1 hypothetical protein K493DRAFT_240637 [Basidiobolus meristosporus CBS 931.73]
MAQITQNAIPALTTGGSGSLGIDIDLILMVHNPNLISIKLSNITATGYYQINGVTVDIGKGALNQSVTFPAKGDLTFPLPFHLLYTASDPNSQAALKDLVTRCGILGGPRQPLSMSYVAQLDIALISWLGIKPTISNNISFDCPLTP